MAVKSEAIWLTWEDHRRSRELSGAFGAEYLPLLLEKPRYVRYPWLAILTIWTLIVRRPKLVFCQNPSIVLAFILTSVKPIFRYTLVVDRHSNFKFEHQNSKKLKWKLFWLLSRATVKFADVTVVTNEALRKFCDDLGGWALVLPDKLPDMQVDDTKLRAVVKDPDKINVMAVTTFGGDEPVDEIIESALLVGSDFQFYLTGKCDGYLRSKGDRYLAPDNVFFTGFISELDYRALMKSADVVLVLTTKDLILNCGAYEAVSAERPLVLSNTDTLRSYFSHGALFVDLDSKSIANGVIEAAKKAGELEVELRQLKKVLEASWRKQFENVVEGIP